MENKRELLVIGEMTPRMMAAFARDFTVHELSGIDDIPGFLNEAGERIEAIATFGAETVPQQVMDGLPNLKIISCYGVGYDGIDTQTAVKRGIVVTHTPNVLNNDVANTAILLMLAVSRQLVRDDCWVRSGNWKVKGAAPLTRSIEDKTVGIVGLGRIGETIAAKLQAFSCKVCYHSRNPRDVAYPYFADLVAMAKAADYLIVITPGGAATRHLIDRAVLDALGPDGTLVNVARGSVVDEAAMVAALREGRLGYAGLDVFEAEPHVPEELFAMDNVVLLPHVGSATVETRQAMGDLTVENLQRFFKQGRVTTPVPECAHLVEVD
ncbi:2-hydroxyacid dehydrogenase [Salaquimonas pukyongi]|uniref:2-hydroxyacid dehydrogenase n=1 Tax=Salaquimonas pukyongi TaxID=2712698 RepID=UPI00096BC1FA|nr:2-hydroxyacid dehydrogenase [Salaquimonas pukyongi]